MQKSRRRAFLAGAATLASIGARPASAPAAQFSWKIGCSPAADHPVAVRITEASEKVRKETGGLVDIQVFPNSALGGADAMISQLRLGALEMMAVGGGAITLTPSATILALSFAFKDPAMAFAAMDGDLGALIRNEFPAKGFVALDRIYDNGFRHFTTSTKPIHTAADLDGIKLRVVPSKLAVDTFRSLGAAVTGIEPRQLYLALQTHVVDGQETPLVLLETFRYYEVQKYLSLSHHMWDGFWIAINRPKWENLPKDAQETIRRNFNAGALLQRHDIAVKEKTLRDLLHRQGLAINEVDAGSFRAKLASTGYYARWREEYGQAAWTTMEKYTGPIS